MREDGQAVDEALYSLAVGPDTRVRHYESCSVGDVRYSTLAHDETRKPWMASEAPVLGRYMMPFTH